MNGILVIRVCTLQLCYVQSLQDCRPRVELPAQVLPAAAVQIVEIICQPCEADQERPQHFALLANAMLWWVEWHLTETLAMYVLSVCDVWSVGHDVPNMLN